MQRLERDIGKHLTMLDGRDCGMTRQEQLNRCAAVLAMSVKLRLLIKAVGTDNL